MEPLPPLSEFLAITFERPSPLNPGIGPQLASSVTRRTCRMDFSGPRNSPIPVEHAQAIDSRDLFIRGENMRSPDPEHMMIKQQAGKTRLPALSPVLSLHNMLNEGNPRSSGLKAVGYGLLVQGALDRGRSESVGIQSVANPKRSKGGLIRGMESPIIGAVS
ncbi:hypothetical protein FOVG_19272 [Fusarium oxysporum f. sp. pisi HDV247]|uniref:Uncharacterized protein n=1 Tax=Fusarium oxysporum f. sp. pisi HDV247 TaxID=1080344 RepID=W9NMV4_FUSOX|nr:hypothetical protein FOVG_19272 [Fusarium oxysporum f. sp. pisi HDV247]KAJ0118966.1 Uncharacterized protein HZ326_31852 [Fusarium oxysporum f. sp. albedinis]KAK2469807.1 hypothetical protein H9L39_18622 [Fusarium oxysporum f. sp. albedinis]